MADEDEGQEQSGSGLRKQLEDALEANKALKQQLDESSTAQRELAFVKAGIDTSEGVGKLLAKTYDGDLDPEAITAYAQEYGVDTQATSEARAQEAEADTFQQRSDALRQNSRPDASGEKLSVQEWHELSARDPLAAQSAHAEGRVEFPPHMAQQLAENRQANRLGA